MIYFHKKTEAGKGGGMNLRVRFLFKSTVTEGCPEKLAATRGLNVRASPVSIKSKGTLLSLQKNTKAQRLGALGRAQQWAAM